MIPAQSTQILLVARRDPQDPLGRTLRGAGYPVVSADSVSSAVRVAERTPPALIVADPRALTPASREQLAAFASEHGIPLLQGWPSPEALLTEVKRLLGGGNSSLPEVSQLVVGPLEIDVASHQARVGGTRLDLTAREFDLLAHFACHPGWVYSRQELLEQVWGYEYGDTKVVTVHIANLRRKLEAAAPEMELIETVRNVGYRLVAPATENAANPAPAPWAEAPDTSPPAKNPLYQRVFVGRDRELNQLEVAFEEAISGQGTLRMVMGEPGIGKTALCEQLSNYVSSRGGQTLLGHCYEEGSLSLPYLAFVEALRTYVMTRPREDLREELGNAAGDLAQIVFEIQEKLEIRPKPKGKNPEEERYRLLQGVSSLLSNAASIQPLLVVLEDLHDADKGTLDMLIHVARNLSETHLLIVGTYRDVEVDRTHPLSAALAELRRLATYDRVPLRGLNPDEVHRLMEATTQEAVPWSISEAVHRQTEGNPLFAQEVVRYLVEEGLFRPGDTMSGATGVSLGMVLPEGLRDVIGKRLSLLTQDCNQLLSVAAVIGREFLLETLQSVVGMEEAAFIEALREAVQLSVVEERSQEEQIRYRFTHAFFRQTLYEELIAPQRLKLHQQIARTLELQYTGRLQEHASELAEHFFHSTDPRDLKKAVSYGELAAQRAIDLYAYGEAARLLEQTIKVQQILNPDDRAKLCDLRLDLCDVRYTIGDLNRIVVTEAPAAFSLAESLGDSSRAIRACIFALFSIVWSQLELGFETPEADEWIRRVDHCASPDTVERAYADAVLGDREYFTGDKKSGMALLDRAADLVCDKGDEEDLWLVGSIYLWCFGAPQCMEKRYRLAEKMWAYRPQSLKAYMMHTCSWILDSALAFGHRELAEEVRGEVCNLAERSDSLGFKPLAEVVEGTYALMDGRLEEATELVSKYLRGQADLADFTPLNYIAALPGITAELYLGTSSEALLRGMPPTWDAGAAFSCLLHARLGHADRATELLDEHVVLRPEIGTEEDGTITPVDTLFLEAAVLVHHVAAAELLLQRLSSPSLYIVGMLTPTCVARHLGGAAALLGRHEDARRHYYSAIRICAEMPFRPELALSKLGLAELLLEHYPEEKVDALEHLDFAIGEFREMKMQPSLERALRNKEILKA